MYIKNLTNTLKGKLLSIVIILSFILGLFLLLTNVYGLTQELKPQNVPADALRFSHKTVNKPFEEVLKATEKLPVESDVDYATRVTKAVSDSLLHIQWEAFPNDRFNQLVPFWENYILYFMGLFSNIPEYERYHFASYKRSLKRGIGVCGDASMILSQLLDKENITNEIISFPKHVIVRAQIDDQSWLLDPDFGVHTPLSFEKINQFDKYFAKEYLARGYTEDDLISLRDAYQDPFQTWQGVSHFITNKYYFEKIAYVAKWLIPLILILPLTIILVINFRQKKPSL